MSSQDIKDMLKKQKEDAESTTKLIEGIKADYQAREDGIRQAINDEIGILH
jgi:hypothetical protein